MQCNMILFCMFHALKTATCASRLRDKNEITKAQQFEVAMFNS
jgi:uncharacterized protein YhhL (DUF1145 family)